MALEAKKISFLLNASNGPQELPFTPEGANFTPKLAMFFGVVVTPEGIATNYKFCFGAATLSDQFALATTGTHGVSSAQHHAYHTSARCGYALLTSGSIFTSFRIEDFETNKVIIDVTQANPTFQRIWHCIALGGDDVEFFIKRFQYKTSAGTQPETGCPFEPTFGIAATIFNASTPPDLKSSAGYPRISLGWFDGVSQASMANAISLGSYEVSRWSESNVLGYAIDPGSPVTAQSMAVSSFTSDGFVGSYGSDVSGTADYAWMILGRGTGAKVHNFTSASSTSPPQNLTGLGVDPKLFMLMSAGLASESVHSGRARISLGAASSTSARGAIGASADYVSSATVEYNSHELDHCLTLISDNALLASCDLTALAIGTAQLTWDAASAVRCSALVLGDPILTVNSDAGLPVAWDGNLVSDAELPAEWLQGAAGDALLPVEWLGNPVGDATLPVEWRNEIDPLDVELPLDWWDTSVDLSVELAVEWLGQPAGDAELPLSWLGSEPIASSAELPLEWRSEIEPLDVVLGLAWLQGAEGIAELPLEWKGLLSVSLSPSLPIEWVATLGVSSTLPIEWGGPTVISRDVVIPLEWKTDVVKAAESAVEWRGLIAAASVVPIEWKATTAAVVPFPLAWLGSIARSVVMPVSWRADLAIAKTLPIAWLERITPADAEFPVAWLESIAGVDVLPMEWSGGAGVALNVTLPVEWRTELSRDVVIPLAWEQRVAGDALLPVEWRGNLNPTSAFAIAWQGSTRADRVLPMEWRAELLRSVEFPLSWQQVIAQAFELPLEWPEGVARFDVLPLEWSGGSGVGLSVVLPVEWRTEIARAPELGVEWKGNAAGDALAALEWLHAPDGSAPVALEWRGEILTFAVFPVECLEGVSLSVVSPVAWQQSAASNAELPIEWRAEDVPDVAGGIWILGPRGSVWRLPARSSLATLSPRTTISGG